MTSHPEAPRDAGRILLEDRSSGYALTLFRSAELKAIEIFDQKGKPYLTCATTGRARPAKPEEIVRQLYLGRLMGEYGYPKERIAVERGVYFGSTMAEKRADIAVLDKYDPETAYIIVELKKPNRRDDLEQFKSYCNAEGSPIGVWTDGGEIVFLRTSDSRVV